MGRGDFKAGQVGHLSPPAPWFGLFIIVWGALSFFSIPVLFGPGSFAPRPARLRGAEDGVETAGRAGGVPPADDLSGGESRGPTGVARQAAGPVAGERSHHRRRPRHRAPARSRVRRTRRQKGTGGGCEARGCGTEGAEDHGSGGCAHLPPLPEPAPGVLRVAGHPTPLRHPQMLS